MALQGTAAARPAAATATGQGAPRCTRLPTAWARNGGRWDPKGRLVSGWARVSGLSQGGWRLAAAENLRSWSFVGTRAVLIRGCGDAPLSEARGQEGGDQAGGPRVFAPLLGTLGFF